MMLFFKSPDFILQHTKEIGSGSSLCVVRLEQSEASAKVTVSGDVRRPQAPAASSVLICITLV